MFNHRSPSDWDLIKQFIVFVFVCAIIAAAKCAY